MNGGPGGGGPRGRSNTLGARLQEEERGGESGADVPPPCRSCPLLGRPRVPGLTALGPSSSRRRRPETPAAPEQLVAVRVTSPRWGFQRLRRESRESSLLGGAQPPTPTLLYNFGLRFGISPSLGLGEGLFGPLSLFSDGLSLLRFLLRLLHFPVSACSLHSALVFFHHPTWHSLQEKVALLGPDPTLDH